MNGRYTLEYRIIKDAGPSGDTRLVDIYCKGRLIGTCFEGGTVEFNHAAGFVPPLDRDFLAEAARVLLNLKGEGAVA